MNQDLFAQSAPLKKTFGVESFTNALRHVNKDGEAFLHELCHVLSLEHRGVVVELKDSYRSNPGWSLCLSNRVDAAVQSLEPLARSENECEALAIELLLMESSGHIDIRRKPETLGIFLRDIWEGQPALLRRKMFNRSFRKFVLHILELRDQDWIRDAASKAPHRVRYWRNKCASPSTSGPTTTSRN